jgi:hypothetical protein
LFLNFHFSFFIFIFHFLFDADKSVSASFTISSESYVRYSEKALDAFFIIFFKSFVLTFSDLNSVKYAISPLASSTATQASFLAPNWPFSFRLVEELHMCVFDIRF